ncbi:MAG: amidase [Acidimicrobiia bacterium]
MADVELAWTSAWRLRELIGSGEISPVEVIDSCLARIEAIEPHLHSLVTVDAEQARAQAKVAADAVTKRQPLGPLHGVPVALKDELWTQGIASTGGSALFSRFVPTRDGTVAERLRAAGAIIVAKSALPEFATWPRTKTRLGPETVNPWDDQRIPGASSGGSAAAVAAGLFPIAIGSDGGGSIRIPSALCGVFGMFPTPGSVPCYGSFSYATGGSMGPITRDVRDAALVHAVIAGPDDRDGWALTTASVDPRRTLDDGVAGVRIGWSRDFGRVIVQSGIGELVEQAVALLASSGAQVDEIRTLIEHPWGEAEGMAMIQSVVEGQQWDDAWDPADVPSTADEEAWLWSLFASGTPVLENERFRKFCLDHVDLLAPNNKLLMSYSGPTDDPEATARYERMSLQLLGLLERYDVVCSPTMAVVAPLIPSGWAAPYADSYMGTNFTFIANTLGCPAASIPCGFVDGLPVAMQIIGRPGDEANVLRVCRAYEAARPAFPRPPLG